MLSAVPPGGKRSLAQRWLARCIARGFDRGGDYASASIAAAASLVSSAEAALLDGSMSESAEGMLAAVAEVAGRVGEERGGGRAELQRRAAELLKKGIRDGSPARLRIASAKALQQTQHAAAEAEPGEGSGHVAKGGLGRC